MEKVKLSKTNKYICIHPIYLDRIYKQGSIVTIDNIAQALDLIQKKMIKKYQAEVEKVGNEALKEKQQIDLKQNILEVLRVKYAKQYGKAVPNRYKNNVEWIKAKL